MASGTPPNAQQLLQGLLKCRDCGTHMITVADTDGKPTQYACPTLINNETDNCSIPKLEIQELDKLILEKALEHLLTESIPQDTVNKMQDAIAASVKDFDTANYLSVLLNSDMTSAREALNMMIGEKWWDQTPWRSGTWTRTLRVPAEPGPSVWQQTERPGGSRVSSFSRRPTGRRWRCISARGCII